MAEVAVSRLMFADILSLIARLLRPRGGVESGYDGQTTEEVRLDASKSACFRA